MLKKDDEKIKWFKEARFGMFIHWGLYSATEGYWNGKETIGIGEWIQAREEIPGEEYEKFAEKLTCEKFNPAYWAELAKKAGMEYCVFTAKHHEGFAMFDTAYDDYSIVKRSPYGKDVVAPLMEAMRKEKIVPCLYYSQALDFHEKNAWGNTWDYSVPEQERDFDLYINGKCKEQLKELLTKYGKLGLLWMDVPKWLSDETAQELKNLIYEYQPECLVSGRITSSNQMGDFGCYGDNQIPAGYQEGCWETAATLNNTWGYKRDEHHYKSVKEILELLCDLMAKGTNLLLNIGPRPDGSLTEETIAILEEIGKWHDINGEAIHGTEASPFACDVSFGGISQKENVLYLYVYEPQQSIDLYGLENTVCSVSVLGGEELSYRQKDGLFTIDTRNVNYDSYVTVLKVALDGRPKVKENIRQQEKGKVILPAYMCEIIEGKRNLENPENFNKADLDAALQADINNMDKEKNIYIDIAGIVKNWKSEEDFLSWEFYAEEAGEFAAYLYTVAEKYQKWEGGHQVHLENEDITETKLLTADQTSRGANQRYYAETGSLIGNVHLTAGINTLKLFADSINKNNPEGLGVSKLVLIRK